jgi:hypothetical protein
MTRRTLRVEVVVPDPDPEELGPQVRLLIDGEDYLAEVWPYGVGSDPDDLIGPFSPLRAGDVPRDAALMRCSCGISHCALLVANISREGDEIVWDDFRMGPGMDIVSLAPIEPHTLRFEAAQYLTELDRAHEARPWEPRWRTAGRLAREAVLEARDDLEARGFVLKKTWHFTRRIEPKRGLPRVRKARRKSRGLGVELYEYRDAQKRQVVLAFDTDGRDPVLRADRIAQTILRRSQDEWPVAYRGEWLSV